MDIRPGLISLRECPTLRAIADGWGRIELKLETPDTRYWLTTEGLEEKSANSPVNHVVNYITVEKRTKQGDWDLAAVYSPEAWKLSQGFDYCQSLYRELRVLTEKQEREFSWEIEREIDRLRAELQHTNQAVLALSEQVCGVL